MGLIVLSRVTGSSTALAVQVGFHGDVISFVDASTVLDISRLSLVSGFVSTVAVGLVS